MKQILLILFFISSLSAQPPFSSDSALSYLKTISVDIGPRPMGSPGENRAMEFALSKFREFGLDDVYLMKMPAAELGQSSSLINTNSGIAVGILKGKTDRIILIGGHIDSADPDIPGANDDGSGSASVIELARVLSKEQHQSTIVFCLFGGEERGICGSEYFVRHFSQIDSINLMLQLDMANGSDILIPTIDGKSGNSPIWLVEAAYEEFADLGYSKLSYPAHFFSFMSGLPGEGVTSDHKPFLDRNIPAIDFTSDVDDPIHTQQDNFRHFKPAGLKRSGDLVYNLVHRFDKGVPPEKKDRYFLFQIGNRALFFPIWLLSAFIIVSVILAGVAVVTARKRRTETEAGRRPSVPGLKLFLLALLIQTFVWLSENVVGLIKGIRYPWFADPNGYFMLAFIAAIIGIAVSLKISPYLKLSRDPYRWFLRSVIFLLTFIVLFFLINTRIALYPAIGLFCLSLAMLVKKPWLKLVLWLASPHFMFRLIFSEGFVFMGRGMALNSIHDLWMYLVLHVFYILFFALWSFPFLSGFAAIYFDSGTDLLLLKKWRTVRFITAAILVFAVNTAILVFIPSYSDEWRQNIDIEQSIDLKTGKAETVIRSAEYLKNVNLHFDGKDTAISTWDREILLKEFEFKDTAWVQTERTTTVTPDSDATFNIMTKIHFKYRPVSFSLSYSAGKGKFKDISGPYVSSMGDRFISMRWEFFPDTSLLIPIHFRALKSDSLTETLEVKFKELIEPVRIEKELANISSETKFRRTELLQTKNK